MQRSFRVTRGSDRKSRIKAHFLFGLLTALPVFLMGLLRHALRLDWAQTLMMLVVIACASHWLFLRLAPRFFTLWMKRYEILLGDDEIIQKQEDSSDIVIRRGEIVQIERGIHGTLVVKTRERFKRILLLPVLDNFDDIVATLRIWHEFEPEGSARIRRVLIALLLILLIALNIFNRMEKQPIWMLVEKVIFATALIWALVEILCNPYASKKMKRLAWLIFPAFLLLIFFSAFFE